MAEHLHFNAIFIILQQTAVRRPWELGAGSIWFYGSRSFYATSTGMLNGMAVCLMNRFKTQVSPRGCAVSSFLSSIYAEEIMCNNNCLVPTGWPGGPVPFPVREQRKIYCSRLDFILPLRLSQTAPHPPPPVRVVRLVFSLATRARHFLTPMLLQRQQLGECDVNSNAH